MPRQADRFAGGGWHSPAAERNKEPILEVIERFLPRAGLMLEIGSGTGQHVLHFAGALPQLSWQPSDADAQLCELVRLKLSEERPGNVHTPLHLDVLEQSWPLERADAVLSINMIHVAPWAAAQGLIDGSARLLAGGGLLFLYGPFRRGGRHTSPGNKAFDANLRAQNPRLGLRDLEDVVRLAEDAGFTLADVIDMPANNFSVIFRKRDTTTPAADGNE